MYRMNEHVTRLLRLYAAGFASPAQAASGLGISSKAFKSLLAGEVRSLPRERFHTLLDHLRHQGHDEAALFAALGVREWREVLELEEQDGGGQEKDRILLRIGRALIEGRTDIESDDPDLTAAAKRRFGSLALAIRSVMRTEARDVVERVREHLEARRMEEAIADLNRFESLLYHYLMKMYGGPDPLERAKKENIIAHIRPYMKIKETLKEEVGALVEDSMQALYPGVTLSERIHRKKTLDFHRWELARSYSAGDRFRENEYLFHPGLGIGKVIEIVGRNRIRVQFENATYGIKELTANMKGFMDTVMQS